MLGRENIDLEGKNCVVVGRSNIVGKPMSMILLNKNATVTICHSRIKNLEEICANADVLVAAVGKPNLITKNMVKQGANMRKVNNQKFVQIPFLKFVNMLKYKCELVGIEVICIQEFYTSRCSFIDKESIEYHKHYLGNRIYRGLYESANRIKINADVNASYNILRKYLNEAKNTNIYDLVNLVEVCSAPVVYTVGLN